MAKIEAGSSASRLVEVDATSLAMRTAPYDASGNPIVRQLGDAPATPAGITMLGLNDRALYPVRSDRMGNLASALHTPLLADSFEGTTVHPIRWLITSATMAAAQSSAGGLVFNSGAITTASTGYMIQSARRFLKMQKVPLQARFRARLNKSNNSVMELGFADAATANGANTVGAYWQVTASGAIVPVLTFNSVDVTGSDISGLINNANYYVFDVVIDDDEVIFFCQDSATGLILSRQSMRLPVTALRFWSSTQVAAQVRLYNTGAAPVSAPQLILADAYACYLDAMTGKPWSHVMAGMERGPLAHPLTGAQLAQWANSAEPASATLSNTAAGYTTLGGKFQFAAVAGAATDFALFGFQVPAPANMIVTGIDIEAWNLGAAVATTPTLLTWAVAAGATAVTLASGTPNRVGLGVQSLPIGAAIGAKAERISKQFSTPLFVGAGRFLHVILRMPVATATASQVIAGMVNVEASFE